MWYLTMGQKSLLQNWKRQWAVSVSCKFRSVVDGYIWAFSGIYDPMQLGKEDNCGRNLQGYTVGGDLCVCVFLGGGGVAFNVNNFPSERVEAERISTAMWNFYDFISNQRQMDLPLKLVLLPGPTNMSINVQIGQVSHYTTSGRVLQWPFSNYAWC